METMHEDTVFLPEDVIPHDAKLIDELPAVCPEVAWGAAAMLPPCVVYRLAERALFDELRAEIQAAAWNGPNLAFHLERPMRRHPPRWTTCGAHRRCEAAFDAIYLLGPAERPRDWRAAARLGRSLQWDDDGQLTYTASPGLLFDRSGQEGSNLHAWLLAADLGVLCADELLCIARRAYGKIRELLPAVISDDPAAWFNTRGIKLFAAEFLRVIEDCDPRDMAPLGLPRVEIGGSW